MARLSAGILLYRLNNGVPEVLLVHPGGPWFVNQEKGAWSIPKGEFSVEEDPFDAAKRELKEETGIEVNVEYFELKPVRQKGGKKVLAWAAELQEDVEIMPSNTFKMEYPPKSGKWQNFPEVDKAGWFDLATAREKINPAQLFFLQELVEKLGFSSPAES